MTNTFPLNIFIADDDQDDILLFQEAILTTEFKDTVVTVFNHGKQVCQYIQDSIILPDVIFLDINMPLMNGKDCLKEIRANKKFIGVPIVMYTTSVHQSEVEETYRLGATLYVGKATSFSGLQFMLQKVLSQVTAKILASVPRSEFVFDYKT